MTLNEDVRFILSKAASFINIAVDQLDEQSNRINELRKKEARYQQKIAADEATLDTLLKKAADSLYDSDFLTDEFDRKKFLKEARENPVLALVNTLEKVCKAADVSLIGIPAAGAGRTTKKAETEFDPVAARAFGYGNDRVIFE